MRTTLDKGVAADCLPARAVLATPPAAAPATASEIHSHLCPGPVRVVRDEVSDKNCPTTVPARACPFTAVMRISKLPTVRFHCIPQAPARPSACVVMISVLEPLEKDPPGPSSGNMKLTVAPSTGLPVSSVTSSVMPRVARAPIG